MTLANLKVLLENLEKQGNKEAVQDILDKYPQIKRVEEVKPIKKEKKKNDTKLSTSN